MRRVSTPVPSSRRTGDARGLRLGRAAAMTASCLPVLAVTHLATSGATPPGLVLALVGLTLFGAALLVPAAGTLAPISMTVAAQLLGQVLLSLWHFGAEASGGCLPAVGTGARLGLRLAILRIGPTCPNGTALAGPTTRAALTAVLVAVAVLAAHAVSTLVAVAAMRLPTVWERVVLALVRLVPPIRTALVPAPLVARLRMPVSRPQHRPGRGWDLPLPVRRGPPAPALA
jgi:hypothetical protein